MIRVAAVVLALASAAWPQNRALLSSRESLQLCERAAQLMESTSATVPDLGRAAGPVTEKARQELVNLKFSPQNSGATYAFLNAARGFLALSDASAKPFPFPEEARRQFTELRAAVDRLDSHFRALLDLKETQVRPADRDRLARYAEANRMAGPPVPGRPRVVFLGDSITDGWRLNEYFTGRDFVNRGISGQITGEMLGRMKADVIDMKPQALIVLAGTNDIARGVPVSAIQNNLTMIADLAEFHKIKPLFASVLPVSDYHKGANPSYERTKQRPPATILELNTWLKSFCARRNFTYVDYFAALADQAGMLGAELADDGLHPNAQGYRLMAPLALAAIDAALKPEPAGKKKRK